MQRFLNKATVFAVYGLVSGVYYRELCRLNGYTGATVLGIAHPHILALGLGGFLLAALFVRLLCIADSGALRRADSFYTVGLILTTAMMLLRGTYQVTGIPLGSSMSGAISAAAGLGHAFTAVGIISLISVFKKAA